MKLYNDLPLSIWLDTFRVKVFSHKWGDVDTCVLAVCTLIDRQDLFDSYRECDFGTVDFIDAVWNVYYAGRRYLRGSGA